MACQVSRAHGFSTTGAGRSRIQPSTTFMWAINRSGVFSKGGTAVRHAELSKQELFSRKYSAIAHRLRLSQKPVFCFWIYVLGRELRGCRKQHQELNHRILGAILRGGETGSGQVPHCLCGALYDICVDLCTRSVQNCNNTDVESLIQMRS